MNIKENMQVESTKLTGIAMILASIPLPLVYWTLAFITIALAFLIWLLVAWLAVIALTIFWLAVGLVAIQIGIGIHKNYHNVMRTGYETRAVREQSRRLYIANETSIAKLEIHRQLPSLASYAMDNGKNFEFGGMKISDWRSHVASLQSGQELELIESPSALPTLVRYEDIKKQIPEGHNVVGISGSGLITKEDRHIGACVWIIGGSGTGKTSTTSLRLEERADCGHVFYGVDPHWFKDDSLTNAVVGFSDRFLLPMARDTREAKHVLSTFLKVFQDRKAGKIEKPFQKITLVVDEVGSLNDPQSDEEEEVLKLLKTITRICGQEARNFNMGGIFISQQATGLYWIGNVALLVVVHKLIKENQQKLATQTDDKQLFAEMRVWPKGRTYVYGMGLEDGEGCLVLQQPYFEKGGQGQWVYPEIQENEVIPQATDLDVVYEACEQIKERGMKVTVRSVAELVPFGKTKVSELMQKLEAQGCQIS